MNPFYNKSMPKQKEIIYYFAMNTILGHAVKGVTFKKFLTEITPLLKSTGIPSRPSWIEIDGSDGR